MGVEYCPVQGMKVEMSDTMHEQDVNGILESTDKEIDICNKISACIQPHTQLPYGMYSYSAFAGDNYGTATDAMHYANRYGEKGPDQLMKCMWQHKQAEIKEILNNEGNKFIKTLDELQHGNIATIKERIDDDEIPKETLAGFIGVSSPEEIAYYAGEDAERANNILDRIAVSGTYLPPALDDKGRVIDGAHRILALERLLGDKCAIDVWQAVCD